jgi:hypothetical protein
MVESGAVGAAGAAVLESAGGGAAGSAGADIAPPPAGGEEAVCATAALPIIRAATNIRRFMGLLHSILYDAQGTRRFTATPDKRRPRGSNVSDCKALHDAETIFRYDVSTRLKSAFCIKGIARRTHRSNDIGTAAIVDRLA